MHAGTVYPGCIYFPLCRQYNSRHAQASPIGRRQLSLRREREMPRGLAHVSTGAPPAAGKALHGPLAVPPPAG